LASAFGFFFGLASFFAFGFLAALPAALPPALRLPAAFFFFWNLGKAQHA
jgi:hypothetical protein